MFLPEFDVKDIKRRLLAVDELYHSLYIHLQRSMSIVKGIALVTASAQGIGRCIALGLARDGFDIALNDVSSKHDQLRAVADDIEKICRRTLTVPADVTVDGDVRGMVDGVASELGGVDVVGTASRATVEFVHENVLGWSRMLASISGSHH